MKLLLFATSLVMVVLAVDLLGLYYHGRWYDPNPLIEVSEVSVLYTIAILGLIQSAISLQRHLRKAVKMKRIANPK